MCVSQAPERIRPLAEAVRLSELKADVVDRLAQPRGRGFRAPQIPDALVFRGQRVLAGCGNALQCRAVAVAGLIDVALAFARGGIGCEVQRVVDHAEVVLVMEEPGVGVDLRVHADPELHIALELRRPRHRLLASPGRCARRSAPSTSTPGASALSASTLGPGSLGAKNRPAARARAAKALRIAGRRRPGSTVGFIYTPAGMPLPMASRACSNAPPQRPPACSQYVEYFDIHVSKPPTPVPAATDTV